MLERPAFHILGNAKNDGLSLQYIDGLPVRVIYKEETK